MQINKKKLLALALIVTGHVSVAEIRKNWSGVSPRSLLDTSGMVSELCFDNTGKCAALNLTMRYEQPAMENEGFGGYCHLYSDLSMTVAVLIVSAPSMKCFYFQDDLIVFVGNSQGLVEQVKVYKDFTKYKKGWMMRVKTYTSYDKNLLADIDTVKLIPEGILIMAQTKGAISRFYSEKQSKFT